ncbi:hypothetical protein [Prochlorococcus marinus]|nr:hypothetical protein [Prochlorococcus marinus]
MTDSSTMQANAEDSVVSPAISTTGDTDPYCRFSLPDPAVGC